MPQSLTPVPLATPVVDSAGAFTSYMRLRWQELIDSFTRTPTKANEKYENKNAALATTRVFTTQTGGRYRIAVYLRKTVADGVSSSAQVTVGWTEGGSALTETFTALTTDTATAHRGDSILVNADANTDVTIAVAYASNTPNQMRYSTFCTCELMA